MANYDSVIQQAKSVQSPQERATLVLQAIENQLGTVDKSNRDEVLTALRSQRQELAQAISGS